MISMEQSLMDAGLLKPAGTILLRETPPVFEVCPHCRRQLNKHGNCPAHGAVVPMNSAVVNTLHASVTEWKQRAEEFRTEANQRRQTIRELEQKTGQLQTELEIAKTALDEKPSVVIQAPDDYKKVKEQAAKLKADLKEAESKAKLLESSIQSLKKEQKQAVDSQVNAKMREYQNELDAIEEKKRILEGIVERKQAYLDSLDSEAKRIETHQSQIAGTRLELISLAAFLNDLDPIHDSDTIKQWRALADMLDTAAGAIHQYINKTCSHTTALNIRNNSKDSLAA